MNIAPFNRSLGMSKWVDDLFENILSRPLAGFDSREVMFSQPSVNVREEAEEFVVEVAAPGLDKQSFNIQVERGYLTVTGEKEQRDEQNEEGKYFRREFNYAKFTRSFQLPDTVNAEDISAKYENGILMVHLPKVEAARKEPVKTIQIQ
ncbi:MAG: Hsp20/alpha crystallin family protein [Lewinellaceae bacterium]|nr:Hsp20/alpha crystallin family protein [Lewinellaceae bacterium]